MDLITEVPEIELPGSSIQPSLSAQEEAQLDAEVLRFINNDVGEID